MNYWFVECVTDDGDWELLVFVDKKEQIEAALDDFFDGYDIRPTVHQIKGPMMLKSGAVIATQDPSQ